MRNITVVTVGRSDYGIYLPLLRRIQADPDLDLRLIVSGMHLSPEFGRTIETIQEDGFEIFDQVEMLLSSDSPEGTSKSMGLGTIGFAQAYTRSRPDVLVVLGDRFEMHAAVLAALPFKIPIAHIHGGEVTQGAIDESLRHSITKLSHLHFVSTNEYAQRVIQLGEEPWRVFVSGAPSLDNLKDLTLLDRDELSFRFQLQKLDIPFLLVTYHPVTLEFEQTEWQFAELLAALDEFDMPVIFTAPNADTRGHKIRSMITDYLKDHRSAQMVENFGTQAYFSIMAEAAAMVGNSSSGIIEAASFHLPVLNIGTRQQGRVRGENVIDVNYAREHVIAGLRKALTPEFHSKIQNMSNPYGTGNASHVIVNELKKVKLNDLLIVKKFYDLEGVVGKYDG